MEKERGGCAEERAASINDHVLCKFMKVVLALRSGSCMRLVPIGGGRDDVLSIPDVASLHRDVNGFLWCTHLIHRPFQQLSSEPSSIHRNAPLSSTTERFAF